MAVMKYYSCSFVERPDLYISGVTHEGKIFLAPCCEPLQGVPGLAVDASSEDILDKYFLFLEEVREESRRFSLECTEHEVRRHTDACTRCAHYVYDEYDEACSQLATVTIGVYPAPCQCKCFYCVAKQNIGMPSDDVIEIFDKLFDSLEHMVKIGRISFDAMWSFTSGEFSIHPLKDRFLDITKGLLVVHYTNCFHYCEKLAKRLAENPRAFINLSIDAGTPETWYKVKGVNNFGAVVKNLEQYASYAREGQIGFKYIILPGVNDNFADFSGVVELMKALGTGNLLLSREHDTKHKSVDDDSNKELIDAASIFAALLYKNNFQIMLQPHYTEEETIKICHNANVILTDGEAARSFLTDKDGHISRESSDFLQNILLNWIKDKLNALLKSTIPTKQKLSEILKIFTNEHALMLIGYDGLESEKEHLGNFVMTWLLSQSYDVKINIEILSAIYSGKENLAAALEEAGRNCITPGKKEKIDKHRKYLLLG